jgi:hypothetical protein
LLSFAELTAGGCAKSTGKKSPAPGRTGPSWLGLRPGRRAGAGARRAAARAGKVDRGLLPDDTYCADQPAGEAGHQPAAAARWHQARSKKGSATFQGLVALLAANNMQLEQIKLVDIGFGVQPLLVKQVDAIMGFSMNEPIEAESGGMAVSLMPISDYGVNTYGLTIVSNPDFMQQKPEVVKSFMKATLRSVAETVKNPAAAVAAVAAAVAETDAKREARVLEHTVPYWQSKETESGGFGWQTEQRWRDTIDVARKLGLIETALRAEDVFVNTYLSK